MRQILVYSDSLSWGIIPGTRDRLSHDKRWPGVLENGLIVSGLNVRVIEDCLNGRRAGQEDAIKPGRNARLSIEQAIESHSPIELVILMLGVNDFQANHTDSAADVSTSLANLVKAIRVAPIEPGMPTPDILVVSPLRIIKPVGLMAEKFAGAAKKSEGLTDLVAHMCKDNNCHFFAAESVVNTSPLDGVHLDEKGHFDLGMALAEHVEGLLDRHFLDSHWK